MVNWDTMLIAGKELRTRDSIDSFSAGTGTGVSDPNFFTDPEYGGSQSQYNEPTPGSRMCVLPVLMTVTMSIFGLIYHIGLL